MAINLAIFSISFLSIYPGINILTNTLFDPKSGEPNFKQTAVQLHSKEVPNGITIQENIAGQISYKAQKEDIAKKKILKNIKG
ncbi:MAG TPA: hypothetical protein EYP79_04820 [Campylobacterales bacterium]|nr:hypothetical protein [Campylobacterales bacterium]